MSLSGACQCGAVRVAVEADPIAVRECWCRDCQKLSGGGAMHNAFFKAEQVAVTGEVRWHDLVAASGNGLARGFCPTCGTPVLVQSHVRRHLMGVRVGIFDETDGLRPQSIIWTGSAPAWACLDPDLPHVEQQAPPAA